VLDLLVVVANAGVDRNPARLHSLRQLAHQINLQEPVFKRRAYRLDVVSKLDLVSLLLPSRGER
jgi:hypothetical protein